MEQVRRLDAPDLVRRVVAAGGPELEPLRLLGGEVGACEVRWPDGHLGVLTYHPPPRPDDDPAAIERIHALTDIARAAGQPIPGNELVLPLADGDVAVVQEKAAGVRLSTPPTRRLVDHMLDLATARRHLLRGHPLATPAPPLFLHTSGPGFCLHESLREHDDRTRAIVEAVDAVPGPDVLPGDDLVHLDYHLENILVAEDDPGRVTAVVDWDGARPGDVGIDLVVLILDLERSAPDLAAHVEAVLDATTLPELQRRLFAHQSLRTVDWALRHPGHDVEWWIRSAQRRLGLA